MGRYVLLVLAAAVAAGCSSGDSTATSTPTFTVSNPPARESAVSRVPVSSPAASETVARPTPASPGQTTPSGFPGPPPPPPPGAKEQGYLTELQRRGVTPAKKENALTIASMVCQGVREGKTDAQMAPFVNVTTAADGGGVSAERTVEQVGQLYIATARQTYCK